MRRRPAVGGDEGGEVVLGRALHMRLSAFAEDERAVLVGAGVLHVVGALVGAGPTPRVNVHQLGMGAHVEPSGPLPAGVEGQADQTGTQPVGHHVGAFDVHTPSAA